MRLVKYQSGNEISVGVLNDDEQINAIDLDKLQCSSLSDLLELEHPAEKIATALAGESVSADDVTILAPLDQQEVWAAGVTYKRSQTARMEESEAAASCYDRVYVSERPELFMKASPHRVSGPNQPLRIRVDATWNVPEPELALVLSKSLRLVGLTVGNDMSSRDIEGDNPLYLPQAKVYDQCCGVGPAILLFEESLNREAIGIQLHIERSGESVFRGETNVGQMARSFEHLIEYLGRDNSFPTGAFLLTGTGIVPDSDFTLQAGDLVHISIDGIGTLSNPVVQGE